MKKRTSILILILVLLLVGVGGYFSAFGATFGYYDILSLDSAIQQGLEMGGGTMAIYAMKDDGQGNEAERLQEARDLVKSRMSSFGYPDAVVTIVGDDSIRIEMPSSTSSTTTLTNATAKGELEFRDEDGNVLMTNDQVLQAMTGVYQEQNIVYMEFTEEGKATFAEATAANIGKTISIYLDSQELSSPTVTETIEDGYCSIAGDYSEAEANRIASMINMGRLPITLRVQQTYTISAALGEGALKDVIRGIGLGFLLCAAALIIVYKVPGLFVTLTFGAGTLVYLLLVSCIGLRMTMSGIVGILLSIALQLFCCAAQMDKAREESQNGKDPMIAVRESVGKTRALVLDVQLIAMIAALVVILSGSGMLKNFGYTLILGSAVAIVFGQIIAPFLYRCLQGLQPNTKKWFSNMKKGGENA